MILIRKGFFKIRLTPDFLHFFPRHSNVNFTIPDSITTILNIPKIILYLTKPEYKITLLRYNFILISLLWYSFYQPVFNPFIIKQFHYFLCRHSIFQIFKFKLRLTILFFNWYSLKHIGVSYCNRWKVWIFICSENVTIKQIRPAFASLPFYFISTCIYASIFLFHKCNIRILTSIRTYIPITYRFLYRIKPYLIHPDHLDIFQYHNRFLNKVLISTVISTTAKCIISPCP